MCNLKIKMKSLSLLAVFIAMNFCDADIYLKPIELSDIEETENIDTLLLVAPDNLRTDSSPNDVEPIPKHNYRSNDSLEFLGGLQLGKRQVETLRKSWRDSCNRKAAKLCRKACVSTYKIVCSAYLCKRGMKRSFKRECKRNCRGRFTHSSRTDSE